VAGSRPRLARSVVALGVVSLFTDASSEMIVPLLPTFLLSLGAGPATLGFIEGWADATSAVLKLVSGGLADRAKKRKPLVLLGYGISSVIRPLVAFATSATQVFAIRFVDRVGKGVRTSPRDAIVADVSADAHRGRAYSFHRAMDHVGAIVGPLVGWLLFAKAGLELRTTFLCAAIPAALALVTLFFFVKEPERSAPPVPGQKPSFRPPAIPRLRRFLAAEFLFALGGSTDAFLLLRAHELGVPITALPLLYAALHVVKAGCSVPFGGLSDRIGRKRVILAGWVVYALVYAGFGTATQTWHAWALFLVYGTYYALTEGAERAFVADLVPAEARGRAFGAFHFTTALAALPASYGFGVLWKSFGVQAAFGCGAVLAGIAALLLAAGVRGVGRGKATERD
jgi:MFS family permease